MTKENTENLQEVDVVAYEEVSNVVTDEKGKAKTIKEIVAKHDDEGNIVFEKKQLVVTEETPKGQIKNVPQQITYDPTSFDELEKAETPKLKEYYTGNIASETYLVHCNKCDSIIALEYLPSDLNKQVPENMHTEKRQLVEVGSKLLAYRVRLDGIMGYQCICGNDSRVSAIEESVLPVGLNAQVKPHQREEILNKMQEDNYKPNVVVDGNITTLEGFSLERVK